MRNNTLQLMYEMGNFLGAMQAEYNTPPLVEDDLITYFKKRQI